MKANKDAQQALISILNKIYGEVLAIEERFGIRMDGNDLRPRIEHFHDAIRSLSSGDLGSSRLTVEFLAYDVALLRRIQANPMERSKGNNSPSTSIVSAGNARESIHAMSARVKSELSELYKNYSVLFVALISDPAERDYQSKVDQCNNEVENIAALEKEVKKSSMKMDTNINLETLAYQYIDDPTLLRKILNQFGSKKNRISTREAAAKLSEIMKASDKALKGAEQAHFNFSMAQLGIYENARDVVKSMAMSGLNIVGHFVENAVREATRSGGRGF